MYKDLRITVVIPCLNEEQAIGHVLDGLPTFVDEVIVVDNNSTDRTAQLAHARGAMVVTELHRGYGRAYKRGFSVASGDIVVTLDGDHSYPVDALSYLIEAFLQCRVGFLSGSRFPTVNAEAMSLKHRIGNRILSLIMSILYLRWITDSQSGMWVFRRDILPRMNLVSDGLAFSEEIKIEAIRNREIGFREMSINYSQRLGEKKLEPWKDGIRNITFLFQKRFSRTNAQRQQYFERSEERLRD
jgi:glycosyltransferase involved in cell wall biosynthesis